MKQGIPHESARYKWVKRPPVTLTLSRLSGEGTRWWAMRSFSIRFKGSTADFVSGNSLPLFRKTGKGGCWLDGNADVMGNSVGGFGVDPADEGDEIQKCGAVGLNLE